MFQKLVYDSHGLRALCRFNRTLVDGPASFSDVRLVFSDHRHLDDLTPGHPVGYSLGFHPAAPSLGYIAEDAEIDLHDLAKPEGLATIASLWIRDLHKDGHFQVILGDHLGHFARFDFNVAGILYDSIEGNWDIGGPGNETLDDLHNVFRTY